MLCGMLQQIMLMNSLFCSFDTNWLLNPSLKKNKSYFHLLLQTCWSAECHHFFHSFHLLLTTEHMFLPSNPIQSSNIPFNPMNHPTKSNNSIRSAARRLGLAPKDVAHHPKHQAPEGSCHEGHREAQPGGHGGAVEEMASAGKNPWFIYRL